MSTHPAPRPSPEDQQPWAPTRPRWLGALALAWLLGLALAVALLVPHATGTHEEVPGKETARHTQEESATPHGLPSGSHHPPRPYPCLSYAPFRRDGHTPFDPKLRITRAQILEDLQLLKPLTDCVRLYGTSHGQEQVPEVAEGLGLQVVLGAWISRDTAASQQEIDTALRLAHQHPGTVRMIVVGNEVLLRQEQSPQRMAQFLRETRSRSPVPVAYADVWEFWLRHAPVLAPEVDVVAVHILPYWEDDPVGLASAVDHVESIYRRMREAFAPRPVWLAETGWPAAGRQRGPAIPGPREQAQFVRGLQARLGAGGVDYNLIEAFDQPWKRQLEGAMGGAWGVVDAAGQLRDHRPPSLPQDPAAQAGLVGLGLGLGLAVCGIAIGRGRSRHRLHPPEDPPPSVPAKRLALLWACAMATVGLALGYHLGGWAIWLRDPAEWAVGLMSLMLAGGAALGALWRAAPVHGTRQPPPNAPNPSRSPWHTALLFLVAWQALNLVFDGRYRPLPAALVGAVALALWTGRLLSPWNEATTAAQRLLASVFLGASPVLMALEGPANGQAWALAAGWVALGVWVWSAPLHRGSAGQPALSPNSAQSRKATAERSVS